MAPRYLINTYRIVDATVLSEYNDLSDAKKAQYALIISSGRINLATAGNAKNVLWSIFGEETTTRANLVDLLQYEFVQEGEEE